MSQKTDTLPGMLVRSAARTAPCSLSARLEEEWLADLHERTSGPSRLAFALGCFWASAAIGRDPQIVSVASAAHGNTATLVQPPRFVSSRAVTFGLVLCLHAAVFYGLMLAGMHAHLFRPADPPPLSPDMIDEPRSKITPPPPGIDLRLTYQPRPPRIDPGAPELKGPADEVADDPNPPDPPPPSLQNPPPRNVIHVQGGVGPGFPDPDEYYPDVARRQEEQGTTTLRVCVNAAGRLTADPVSTQTSGSARLDAAAIRLAKAGSGHYRPSSDDGRPVRLPVIP